LLVIEVVGVVTGGGGIGQAVGFCIESSTDLEFIGDDVAGATVKDGGVVSGGDAWGGYIRKVAVIKTWIDIKEVILDFTVRGCTGGGEGGVGGKAEAGTDKVGGFSACGYREGEINSYGAGAAIGDVDGLDFSVGLNEVAIAIPVNEAVEDSIATGVVDDGGGDGDRSTGGDAGGDGDALLVIEVVGVVTGGGGIGQAVGFCIESSADLEFIGDDVAGATVKDGGVVSGGDAWGGYIRKVAVIKTWIDIKEVILDFTVRGCTGGGEGGVGGKAEAGTDKVGGFSACGYREGEINSYGAGAAIGDVDGLDFSVGLNEVAIAIPVNEAVEDSIATGVVDDGGGDGDRSTGGDAGGDRDAIFIIRGAVGVIT
jgi:hypothetical protein